MNKRTIIAPESRLYKRTDIGEEETPKPEPVSHRRAVENFERKKEFLYPLERITQSKVCYLSVKFPGADEAYPEIENALFRFVSKHYPYAKGGPLWVDEPKNEKEIYRAYERHKVMKKLKLRHIVVENDSTYEHLLEQLGEFE